MLDANGDRSGMSYALLSLAEGKRREVGLIGFRDTASAWRVSVDDSLLWPGGRTEPPHDNYLEPGSGNQTLLFASLISTTLVLCLCGVVGYLLRRNRQLRKAPTKDEHGRITIQMPDPAALLREHISDAVFSELEQHWYICFEELMVTEQQLGAGGVGRATPAADGHAGRGFAAPGADRHAGVPAASGRDARSSDRGGDSGERGTALLHPATSPFHDW